MKKNSKTLLFAILGALTLSGCEIPFAGTNSTSTNKASSTVSNTSSENKTSSSTSELTGDALILDNLKAKILIPQSGATVVDNFELPTTVKYKDYVGNLTWTSNHGSILVDNQKHTVTDENSGATYEVYKAIVIRPEAGSGDANVTLTATVTYNNLSDTKSFKTIVKQADVVTNTEWGVSKNLAVSSWSDWVAATSGDIAVQGVVTAAIYQEGYKNGNVFLQDANGGYYAYGVDMSLEYFNNYFRVGNEVIVEGQKTIYNGLHEFNLKTVNYVKVLDSTGERPAPIDVTEAAASKENGIRNYQAMWVEATGMYIEADGDSYLQFGDYKYELYIDAKYCGDALETVNEQVETFNPGDTVKVTGLVGCYNADQFHPYNLEKQEGTVLTPEQKVAVEASNVDAVLSSYSGKTLKETTTINLHTSNDVTITYALNDEADKSVFALENNTLTVTPVTDLKEATVTATIAYQGVTETKTYTIGAQLPLVAPTDVYSYEITSAAFGLTNSYNSSEETKAIDGVEFAYIQLADYGDGIQMRDKDGKTSRLWNTNAFGNGIERIEITLSDSKSAYDNPDAVIFNFGTTNEVSSYSTKLSTVEGTKTYTITPDVNTYTYFYLEHDCSYSFYYKSIKVILNGYTGEEPSNPDTPVVPEIPTEPVECTIAEALAAADDTPVIVRGIVKSADTWSTQYNNMSVTIIDENLDELYIFRLGTQVAVGDDITVTGKMDTYNNARQIAQGATAVINSSNNEIPAPETPDNPSDNVMTIAEALAAADDTEVVVRGIVKQADTWSTQYNNMSVTIIDENLDELYIFRLGTQVAVGDDITVTGKMDTYNNARQIAQGATAVINSSNNEIPAPEVSENEVYVDFSTLGYENSTEFTSYTSGNVTFSADKGTNSNPPKYYNTGTAVRVYGGGTFTVDVEDGYVITAIEFTFSSGEGSNAITSDVGSFEGTSWTGSSNTVVFTVGGTSGHRRFKAVKVTFAAA